jgi:hypothetical protein
VAASVTIFAVPAQAADSDRKCTQYGKIAVCAQINSSKNYVSTVGEVGVFDANGTSATGCKITTWPILHTPESDWSGPKITKNCNNALPRNGGTNVIVKAPGGSTGTTAPWASAKTCVDLYYNNSSHSGAQLCSEETASVIVE